ncbi:putative RDD family membrane protein YckC [Catenuloplanes nepalensis]|uniref:RDD family membrane protein YckC n=1 Tax=Catenuloplanes nepalensis TaxID=587533 RepID=A0ABT9N3B3_9ACTN|nr:RDD family protein [Catenuloplanes nepalensis]MDP9798194.1 putative RDD family membrane protein YckC [Catenuloplanes nepalensis]
MSDIAPGWYKDPADPSTQRWWDGEGWLGAPLPADATPPDGPPPPEPVPAPQAPSVTGVDGTPPARDGGPQGWPVGRTAAPPQQAPAHPAPGWPQGTPGAPPGWPHGAPPPGWQPGYPPGYPPPGWVPAPVLPHGMPLAGYGARFVARLIDLGVLTVLVLIANSWFLVQFFQELQVYLPLASEYVAATNRGENPVMPTASDRFSFLQLAMLVVTAMVWFAYEVPQIANSGQTLGKRLMGIKTIALEDGATPGFGRAFRRWNLYGTATLFWSCCGIGLLWQLLDGLSPLFDRHMQRAWHDRVAQTVVVQLPRNTTGAPATVGQPGTNPARHPADPGSRTDTTGGDR